MKNIQVKLNSELERLISCLPQQWTGKVSCILHASGPTLYLARWFYLGKLHFLRKVSGSQVASLSIQSTKSAKEDVFSYPILTLLRPAALVFVPAPAAQTAWCCTETQSAGSVHCHHCETSLRQQQRDPGSAGKKGEAQIGSYTAKQGPARKHVFIS